MTLRIRTDGSARSDLNQNYIDGQGQGGYGLLDTWGGTEGLFGLGGKNKDIKEILTNPDTRYTPGEGYNLNWWQKNISKITDQDVYNARRSEEVRDLRKKYGDKAELNNIDIGGTTTVAGLSKQIAEAESITELTKSLNRLGPEGAVAIAKLKKNGNLSSDELLSATEAVKKEIKDKDPDVLAQRAAAAQSLKASQATIEGANSDRSFRETQQTFNNKMSDRTQTFQESQQTFQQNQAAEQARNRWDDKREARRESALTRELNAENNAMQMQLEYSRLAQADANRSQDRKDKAIMALLGGLGNLGAGFTI
jgi:hypothetical protein